MDRAQVNKLRSDSIKLDREIANIEVEQEEYGGLIGALQVSRLEVLRNTRDLLSQRAYAIEYGAPIDNVVQTVQPDLELAKKITLEIVEQNRVVRDAEQEASQYDVDSLLGGLSQSAVIAGRLTLALLNQKRLAAEYGLHIPDYGDVVAMSSLGDESDDSIEASESNPEIFEIVEIDIKTGDVSQGFRDVSWKIVVTNLTDRIIPCTAYINFLDEDRFVISEQIEFDQRVKPSTQSTLVGIVSVETQIISRTRTISAKLRPD